MEFSSLTGEKVGVSMFQHPNYTTTSTRWYYVTNPDLPFFYFSPAVIYDEKIELKQGESLILKYQVWIFTEADDDVLQTKYIQYIEK